MRFTVSQSGKQHPMSGRCSDCFGYHILGKSTSVARIFIHLYHKCLYILHVHACSYNNHVHSFPIFPQATSHRPCVLQASFRRLSCDFIGPGSTAGCSSSTSMAVPSPGKRQVRMRPFFVQNQHLSFRNQFVVQKWKVGNSSPRCDKKEYMMVGTAAGLDMDQGISP